MLQLKKLACMTGLRQQFNSHKMSDKTKLYYCCWWWWDCSLNSGLCPCKAGTLQCEPYLQSYVWFWDNDY
jgi:hypothetical protein